MIFVRFFITCIVAFILVLAGVDSATSEMEVIIYSNLFVGYIFIGAIVCVIAWVVKGGR